VLQISSFGFKLWELWEKKHLTRPHSYRN